MKPIVLIKTGGTIPDMKEKYGDFEDWFADGLGVSGIQQVDVYRGQTLPSLDDISAVVVTGSAAMVSHREDWSENTAAWLNQAVASGLPVLGVCYGHQLLAHALGGEVGLNPNGRQIGTVTARMLDAAADDPLLGHLPKQYPVQTSHSEAVLKLPPGAQRLAVSALDDNFAIRFADKVWGVQYHPEFAAEVMSQYLQRRADALREEGLDPVGLVELVAECNDAWTVLGKFGELFPPKRSVQPEI